VILLETLTLSWEDIERALGGLAAKIKREFDPDVVVGVARGGLIPAVCLSHLLGGKLMRIIHAKYYEDVGVRGKEPEIWSDVGELKGKVLVVDDVADTGDTLGAVVPHIKRKTEGEVRVATIARKPRSKLTPDFCEIETDEWVVFPWEKGPAEKGQ
jgi:hypoxanthine phosphoribosyltransferase